MGSFVEPVTIYEVGGIGGQYNLLSDNSEWTNP